MKRLIPLLLATMLAGCAATTVNVYPGVLPDAAPACGGAALVLWGPAWRANQKEPAAREAIADLALRQFLAENACFAATTLRRQVGDRAALALADGEAIAEARAAVPPLDKVVLVRVEELGPLVNLHLGLVLVDGATEVRLRVRILAVATGAVTHDRAVHWTNGGPYVVKGVASLQQDMVEALKAGFPAR